MMNTDDDLIVITPGIVSGKPRLKGRSISVQHIVKLHAGGWEHEAIKREFNVTSEQIMAALAYYELHKAEIDQSILESEALVKELGIPFSELKERIERRRMLLNSISISYSMNGESNNLSHDERMVLPLSNNNIKKLTMNFGTVDISSWQRTSSRAEVITIEDNAATISVN